MTSEYSETSLPDDCLNVSSTSTSDVVPACRSRSLLNRYSRFPQEKCVRAAGVVTALILTVYVMSKLIMGSLNFTSCQLEPFIPIYLVISSAMFIICVFIIIILIIKDRGVRDNDSVTPVHLITFVYFCINFILQIAGSISVIRTRNIVNAKWMDEHILDADNCNDVLLTYSFGVVILELILCGLLFCFAVVSLCEVICIECVVACRQSRAAIH